MSFLPGPDLENPGGQLDLQTAAGVSPLLPFPWVTTLNSFLPGLGPSFLSTWLDGEAASASGAWGEGLVISYPLPERARRD